MSSELPREEVVAAIDRRIDELLATAAVTAPPVDAAALGARVHGLQVRRDPAARRPRRGENTLSVPSDWGAERVQWEVATELGRRAVVDVTRSLGADEAEETGLGSRSLATEFARRLLVPTAWFGADDARLEHDLTALRDVYATASAEVIAARWLDLPEPLVVTFARAGQVAWRRSNAFRVNKRLSPAEERCLRLVERTGRRRAVQRAGWAVRGWAVGAGPAVVLRATADESAAASEEVDS
jgi:predicted transcriptional regulator